MDRQGDFELKPFFSILIIIGTMFSVVFLKMEVRRIGYQVLKETRQYKTLKDQYRVRSMDYVRITRPDHVRQYAMSRLTLGDARNGQIIQLVGKSIAVPQ